jgi:hypothetical protein
MALFKFGQAMDIARGIDKVKTPTMVTTEPINDTLPQCDRKRFASFGLEARVSRPVPKQ